MNRFTSFLAGVVVGAIGLYASMNFYLVHTDDGVKFVRKISPMAEFPYVDIRKFTISDWQQHSGVAAAMTKAGYTSDIGKSASNSVGNAISGSIDNWVTDQNWVK